MDRNTYNDLMRKVIDHYKSNPEKELSIAEKYRLAALAAGYTGKDGSNWFPRVDRDDSFYLMVDARIIPTTYQGDDEQYAIATCVLGWSNEVVEMVHVDENTDIYQAVMLAIFECAVQVGIEIDSGRVTPRRKGSGQNV